jgi:chemotaxis signal transduction protein
MNQGLKGLVLRAEELRLLFDRSFESAAQLDMTVHENLLGIRVAGDPYAIRLSEISGLFLDKAATPLPGAVFGLNGVAAFRGIVVPVYDLRILLGYGEGGYSRWLALSAPPTAVGLSFDRFENHFRVAPDTIAKQDLPGGQREHVREFLRLEETSRPIINLSSVLHAITTQARAAGLKER